MKKIAAVSCLLMLSACIRAGGNNFWPERNQFVEDLQTIPITFYDNSMRVVKTELITERNFPENKVLSASVGYSVVDDKTYRKIYYAKEAVRANMNGGLASNSLPVEYKKSQQLDMIGEVMYGGKRYALVPTEDKSFVTLIDAEGHLLERLGQIRNNRLILLDSDFIVSPSNFAFVPVTVAKSEQTSPIKGFDIKYGGLKGGYAVFIYYRYDAPSNDGLHDSGEFEVLSYPARPGPIDVRGVGIQIVEAKKNSVDYMILPK